MKKTAEQHREERILHHMTRCVHFNGVQNGSCEAGVSYDAFRVEGRRNLPCLSDPGSECASRKFPTREEAEADEQRAEAGFARIAMCLRAIREKHGKARGLRGEMPCPTGCGGTLRYSIAGVNGHVWGGCSTDGCARWMQ